MNSPRTQRQTLELTLGGESFSVQLSLMRRKSLRLGINAQGEVELRVPFGLPKAQVLAFVTQHSAWLIQKRQELHAKAAQQALSLLWRGKELPIKESALGEFLVTDQAIWLPSGLTAAQRQALLDGHLRRRAYLEYERMIERWWPIFAPFASARPTLRVKKMRSRWGSLSKRGYLNLNLALIQLPEPLLELVVVHELCHLKHFDHGAGFKAMMSQCLPDWLRREQELKVFGLRLL